MEKKTLYLPHELIILILLKLPVISVIRLKWVCKLWFSLISDSQFASSHFEHAASHTSKLVWLKFPNISSIDFEASFSKASPSRELNFRTASRCPVIKGSCRGFLFLHSWCMIYLWNPCTGFHTEIPTSPFGSKLNSAAMNHLYGFGYDHSRDDYLVVLYIPDFANSSSHLEVFSFRDHKWKEIEGTHGPYFSYSPGGLFFNGAIHWMVERDDDVQLIVAFDLMERELLEIPFPDEFEPSVNLDVWVFGEFLSVWTKKNDTLEIFVMKEYKVHSSWTKTLVFRLPIIYHDLQFSYFIPICLTKSGDIIGEANDCFMRLNAEGQLLEINSDISNTSGSKTVIYTESLLSLPGGDIQQV